MFEKLGNIVTISKGRKPSFSESPSENSIRVLQIDDLRNDDNIKYTDEKSGVFAKPEDILIAWDGANAGTIGFGKTGYIGSTIAALRKKNKDFDTVFIGKFLQTQSDFLRKNSTGATIPHISRSTLEELRIPVIPISEQLHIANLLTKAQTLITHRKQTIALLDEFLKSTFLEMFGDPNKNSKEWRIDKLKNLFNSEPQNGLYKPSTDYGEGTRILRIDSFYNGKVYRIDKLKRLKVTNEEIEKYGLYQNDIVINRVNSREYLGKSGLIPFLNEPVVFESNMMRFSINENILNPIFLIKLLDTKYIKCQILKCAKDAVNQSSINQQDVKSFDIIIPPLSLQTQFAQIVEKTESLKELYQCSLHELESLYGSLSQRAFKGELGSRIQNASNR